MPALGVALVSLACVLAPARRAAPPDSFLADAGAQAHYDLAGTYTERGDLRSAVAELDAAYAIERHPDLLFIRAELRRRLGECKAAVKLYRDFIATTPSEPATDEATEGIAACETTLGAEPVPAAAPEVPAAPAPSAVRRPWHRDPAGGVLLAFGLAGLAATGGLAYVAVPARHFADAYNNERDDKDKRHSVYLRLDDRAVALEWSTAAVAVASAGLLVGAIVRYRIVARRPPQMGAWLDRRGAGLTLLVRF
jgi:tetratricopeptide (TPR) repeat protein